MSTRLRTIFLWGSGAYAGSEARNTLELLYSRLTGKLVPPRHSMPEVKRLVSMFEAVTGTGRILHIFREPRGVSHARSRYKLLCEYYGIASLRRKKAPALRVTRNARTQSTRTLRFRDFQARATPPSNPRNRVAPGGGNMGTAPAPRIEPLARAAAGRQFRQAPDGNWVEVRPEPTIANSLGGLGAFVDMPTQTPAPRTSWFVPETATERQRRQQQERQSIIWDALNAANQSIRSVPERDRGPLPERNRGTEPDDEFFGNP